MRARSEWALAPGLRLPAKEHPGLKANQSSALSGAGCPILCASFAQWVGDHDPRPAHPSHRGFLSTHKHPRTHRRGNEVSEFAIIAALMNQKIRLLTRFERADFVTHAQTA